MQYLSDRAQIDIVIANFFAAFDNRAGRVPVQDEVLVLFAEKSVVAKHHESQPELCSPVEFVAPRISLLKGGELVEFHEWEDSATTEVFGSLAVRTCRYSKSGSYNQAPYSGSGTKFFQLAKLASGWKIVALSWVDDA